MPTESASPTPDSPLPTKPNTDLAQRIADEKELRQSGDQQIQILALQFQATRCGEHDTLSGNDDPSLPLVTCSTDGKQVYVLDKSIIGGDQITDATAGVDDSGYADTVEVTFDDAGARTLATFTEANLGKSLAYTIDTHVVSAPKIGEAIPDGRAIISGPTSPSQARALAASLSGGTLPLELSFESSETEQVAVEAGWTPLRTAVLAGGIVVILAVIGGTAYVIVSRNRPQQVEH
jgi:preprotein translocase subunit SecD